MRPPVDDRTTPLLIEPHGDLKGSAVSLGSGVLTHPVTGETCWFNQADLWHARFDTVKAQGNRTVAETPAHEALGSHACFGDGSEIPIEDLTSARAACKRSERLFSWQAGDLLILDNILTMHGRKPFTGERRVLVAMA